GKIAEHLPPHDPMGGALQASPEPEVLGDGQARKDMLPLRDVAHTERRDLIGWPPRDVVTVEDDPARARRRESDAGAEERRLAGAVSAEHGHDLPPPHLDGDTAAHPPLPIL